MKTKFPRDCPDLKKLKKFRKNPKNRGKNLDFEEISKIYNIIANWSLGHIKVPPERENVGEQFVLIFFAKKWFLKIIFYYRLHIHEIWIFYSHFYYIFENINRDIHSRKFRCKIIFVTLKPFPRGPTRGFLFTIIVFEKLIFFENIDFQFFGIFPSYLIYCMFMLWFRGLMVMKIRFSKFSRKIS